MKRLYFLALLSILTPFFSNAQNLEVLDQKYLKHVQPNSQHQHLSPPKNKLKQQKAFRDTLFYDDFDFSAPLNWTIVNNSGGLPFGNGPWQHVPAGSRPGSSFPPNLPLQSTSDTNGYMYLALDSTLTPSPSRKFDTYFSSNAISLNPAVGSVIVKFEQSFRYCCTGSVRLELGASSDGINWTYFDVTQGIGGFEVSPNPYVVEVDVSCVLANQSTGYVRFKASDMTAYYWMIDDVLIYEGPSDNLELLGTEINFHPTYPLVPQYYEVPLPNLPLIGFSGATINGGGDTATNVRLNINIIQDSLIGGGFGSGSVYQNSVQVGSGTVVPCSAPDTTLLPNQFFTFNPAHYSLNYSVSSDSINQQPAEALLSRPLTLTHDSIISLERGESFFDGVDGPGAYEPSDGVGDVLAALVIIENQVEAKGVRFWVDSRVADSIAGISISPRIYSFDQSKVIQGNQIVAPVDSGITGIICQSPVSTVIDTCTSTCPPNQTSIIDTWVDLRFTSSCILQPGAYYFGIEQTAGANKIWTGRDEVASENGVIWQNVMFLAGNNGIPPGWGWGDFVSGIRLIADWPSIVDVNEVEPAQLDFTVYPNPNEGLFTLEIEQDGAATYTISVRNMLGQTVISEAINVNGNASKNMDLSSFEKGVYFISLENGEDRLVRKVVVK